MEMAIRNPLTREMDAVFMMGFDVWGDGLPETEYLSECHDSIKYKRGVWHVLDIDGLISSSLITYQLAPKVMGIGSIATVPEKRKNGFAAKLVAAVIRNFGNDGIKHFLLYTEVGTAYYENFGFVRLPDEHQKSDAGIAMLRGELKDFLRLVNNVVPRYF